MIKVTESYELRYLDFAIKAIPNHKCISDTTCSEYFQCISLTDINYIYIFPSQKTLFHISTQLNFSLMKCKTAAQSPAANSIKLPHPHPLNEPVVVVQRFQHLSTAQKQSENTLRTSPMGLCYAPVPFCTLYSCIVLSVRVRRGRNVKSGLWGEQSFRNLPVHPGQTLFLPVFMNLDLCAAQLCQNKKITSL